MDWQILKEVADIVGKVGLAFLGKALWDRYWEKRKERRLDQQTETAAQADFKKALLSVAAGVVENQVKDLREHIGRLDAKVQHLQEENRILREENATLNARINSFTRQTSNVDR